MRAKNKAHSA